MSWSGNNNITAPNWSGNDVNKKLKNLTVDNINVSSIHGYSAEFNLVDASVVRTGFMFLNNTIMTTFNNILYVNNEAVFVPSSFSTISDWSYFPAKTTVNMSLLDLSNTSYVYAKNVVASNTVTTSNLTAPTISNVILKNVNVNSAFIYGRDIYSSTLTTKIANISLGIVSSLVASNAIIPKLNAYSIVNNTLSSGSIFANNISSTLLTANTINNVLLSSSYISANTLYTPYADLPYIKGSSIEFTTALGQTMAVSSILQNRSFYTPDADDTDPLIAFTNRDFSEFYGLITTSENRSTFGIAGTNNLTLLGVSTATLYGVDGVNIRTNSDRIIQMTTTGLAIDASGVVINADFFNTNAYMSTNAIAADLILANIADFKVLNASTINFDTLNTNNIINSSNINTATLDVSGNANINNLTANGLTVNNSADYNTYISFGTSNSGFYGAQYLYDINSLRNLQVERITVLGGWTGDDIIPPYYNDSIVEIGEDTIRPGQVTINGFNPDPLDTGTALTVRGDTQITQNLNVLGLTTLEGLVEAIGDLNVDGAFTAQGTVDITGITTATGVVNCLGGLGVEGEANFLGAVTAEAGIGVIGAMGVTGGDITFGSPSSTINTFTVHYTTNFSNTVNFGGAVNLSNLNINTLTANNGYFNTTNISTMNGNQIILKTNDFTPASVLFYNKDNTLNSGIGAFDSNLCGVVGFDKTKIASANGTLIESYSNIDISGQSTIFTGNVWMPNLSLSSLYGFNISQSNEIQHWNPYGGYYDYYIPQLSYTDLSNNFTAAVASDWSYYPCKNIELNMCNNFITNVQGLSIQTLGIKQATSGYINAGVVYEQLPGDEMFWQLSKPSLDGASPQGSEGIFVVKRSTADGSDIGHGRLFDDGIYKPVIGSDLSNNVAVVGNLDMSNNYLSNASRVYLYNPIAIASNSSYFKYDIVEYGNATSNDAVFLNRSPFVANTGFSNAKNVLLRTQAIQFVDSSTGGFTYLEFFNNEANLVICDLSNNFISSNYIAASWSKYNASQTVDISNNVVSNVNKMYYASTRQPFIQYGDKSFSGGGTQTVTLPVNYVNSNYKIQATYSSDPGASAKPIHIDSRTTSNFVISAQSGHTVFWTTFGDNN